MTTGSIFDVRREPQRVPAAPSRSTAQSALLVGGAIDTAGAQGANGNYGGAGGPIVLVTRGPLTLGGRLHSEGGNGSAGGGIGLNGGNGGAIELVVQSITSSAGVLSGGGNGGNASVQGGLRGRGGDGGRVRVWSQAPSLMLLQYVDSAGGSGDPNGADGPQQEESAPTGFAVSKTRPALVRRRTRRKARGSASSRA